MTDSIDANLVLRCILGDVPEQRVKVAKLLGSSGHSHYFSSQALLECIYVMEIVEEMSREEIVDLMNFFLARYADIIIYDREMTSIAFSLYLKYPKLSWVDCALAAEAEVRQHEPLMTFDKKMAKQLIKAKELV